jgi:hypothetical protein
VSVVVSVAAMVLAAASKTWSRSAVRTQRCRVVMWGCCPVVFHALKMPHVSSAKTRMKSRPRPEHKLAAG